MKTACSLPHSQNWALKFCLESAEFAVGLNQTFTEIIISYGITFGLALIWQVPLCHGSTVQMGLSPNTGRVIRPSQRPLPDNSRQSKQISMPPAGFEPAIPASHRPQTHALDRRLCQTAFGIPYRPLTDNQACSWRHLTASCLSTPHTSWASWTSRHVSGRNSWTQDVATKRTMQG